MFNMTPMIDVVFLLIIFFLVAGHLARREARIELALPAAASGEQETPQAAMLTISVMASGQIRWADHVLDEALLAASFHDHFNRYGADAAVRIRGDRKVPYRYVSQVLSAAADAGISNVSVATTREIRQ